MQATRISVLATVLAGSAALAGSAVGAAPQQTAESFASDESGVGLFKTYCASCHGKGAKGDGPLADSLRKRPPDLTLLARRNGGTFDADKVHRIIDGRKPEKGHGGSDMPVWGDAFTRAGEGKDEKAVKARIGAIVEFLGSVQVK